MACISRFATAILSGETELALGTIRVNLPLIGTVPLRDPRLPGLTEPRLLSREGIKLWITYVGLLFDHTRT